jgi:hypothetical protein
MTGDSTNPLDALLARVRELTAEGYDHSQAWGTADLERRIASWPAQWGDDLQILIYGDFQPPDRTITVPQLGITVHPEKQTGSFIRTALCVLKANVTVSEKSISSLIDAARRINLFLGAHTLVSWGNSGCGWWSYVTHGTGSGSSPKFDDDALLPAIESACKLPAEVRRKIDAALYWIREPRNLVMESHRPDLLRVFSAYWNAFECLVDAVLAIRPQPNRSKSQKQAAIDSFVAAKSGQLTSADILDCYHQIVNPGLVGKATHAFKVCFPEHADLYVHECFKMKPREDRLYDIRNAINHGDIDAENITELLRVEARLHRLWMIVWRLFGRLIAFRAPAERDKPEGSAT